MSARTAARKPQDAATITTALLALLTALEGIPAGSPAGAAYTAALRRRVAVARSSPPSAGPRPCALPKPPPWMLLRIGLRHEPASLMQLG